MSISFPASLLGRRLGLAVLLLLGLGVWSACGSSTPRTESDISAGSLVTASATADVVIAAQTAPQLTTVRIIPNHIFLSPGETTLLSSAAYDQQGRELPGVRFNWQLVDEVAGTITRGGVFVAGFTPGTFRDAITVVANSPVGAERERTTSSASVTVLAPQEGSQPASIRLLPDRVDLLSGETTQLFAYALTREGTIVPRVALRWEMDAPEAGSVDQEGTLLAGDVVGTFPAAVRVTLLPEADSEQLKISATADVVVLDPEDLTQRISALVLPGVVSLGLGQETRFTGVVLDEKGNQLIPQATSWQIGDPGAGSLGPDGRFHAGSTSGVYPGAVSMTAKVSHLGEELSLTTEATVVVVDISRVVTKPGTLQTVAIFPDRVTLSPGESTRLSVVGLDGDGRLLDDVQLVWSLDPLTGEISPSGKLVAANFPGIHQSAIIVDARQIGAEEQAFQTISATLIIRGKLEKVDVTPQRATVLPGGRIRFRAVGYDKNGTSLPDVTARWSVVDTRVGTIDASGVFTAGESLGEYPGAVRVEMVQRLPSP